MLTQKVIDKSWCSSDSFAYTINCHLKSLSTHSRFNFIIFSYFYAILKDLFIFIYIINDLLNLMTTFFFLILIDWRLCGDLFQHSWTQGRDNKKTHHNFVNLIIISYSGHTSSDAWNMQSNSFFKIVFNRKFRAKYNTQNIIYFEVIALLQIRNIYCYCLKQQANALLFRTQFSTETKNIHLRFENFVSILNGYISKNAVY